MLYLVLEHRCYYRFVSICAFKNTYRTVEFEQFHYNQRPGEFKDRRVPDLVGADLEDN